MKWFLHIIFKLPSLLPSLLLFSCSQAEDMRVRTVEETEQLYEVKESVMNMEKGSEERLDSILAAVADSLDFYDYYIIKGRRFMMTETPDSAGVYAQRTLSFALTLPRCPRTNGLLAVAYATLAMPDHLFRRNQKQSLEYNIKAYNLLMESDHIRFAPEVAANLADAYIALDDLPQGARWYRRALFLVDSLQLESKHALTLYLGLGQIYTTMGDYDTAEHYYQKTDSHFAELKPTMRGYFLNNYGNLLYYKGDYPKALEQFRKLKTMLEQSDSEGTYDMYLCKINLADVFLNLHRPDSAEHYIHEAEPYFRRNDVKAGIYYANTIRIGIAVARRQYDQVAAILASEGDMDMTESLLTGIRNRYLDNYYAAMGNYRMAYENLVIAQKQEDSLEHNKQKMMASEIMLRLTEDTLRLHHKLILDEKNLALSRNNVYFWAFAFIGVLLLFVCIVCVMYVHKRRLQYRIDVLNYRLANARQRISPHFVFNLLNAKISTADEKDRKILMELAKLIRLNLSMVSEKCVTLTQELDFVCRYVELERVLLGKDFDFVLDIPESEITDQVCVPSMFIQILVENAILHGLKGREGAKRLTVTVHIDEALTDIRVADNGPGFDIRKYEGRSTRTGLNIIRHTIAMINEKNKKSDAMRFTIRNLTDDNGDVSGCEAAFTIPRKTQLM